MCSTNNESAAEGCYITPKRHECCCVCRYRVEDRSHPCTDGGSMSERRGWACVVFLSYPGDAPPKVFSGWSEHGMCELFDGLTNG